MTEHLEKAKGALAAAKDLIDAAEADNNGLMPIGLAEEFTRKLQVANTQANIAQAEALERLADFLEGRFG